jgi:hypothetical protein
MATYPLETLACLLPWSPLLIAIVHPKTRKLLASNKDIVTFLVTAIVVAYPTVWIASGARGRYFMPLYPLVAVLIAIVLDRCARAEVGTYPRRAWYQFLLVWGIVIAGAAIVMAACAISPSLAQRLFQSAGFGLAFAAAGFVAVVVIWFTFRRPANGSPLNAVAAIATFASIGIAGAMVNVNSARWSDPTAAVTELRQILSADTRLVSLGPVDHRFVYFYDEDVPEVKWPLAVGDLGPDIDYFCFTRDPKDTPESRATGRGRKWTTTPGVLPFVWEEVATLCAERQIKASAPIVVVGRVVRPIIARTTDVTTSQPSTARLPTGTLRK